MGEDFSLLSTSCPSQSSNNPVTVNVFDPNLDKESQLLEHQSSHDATRDPFKPRRRCALAPNFFITGPVPTANHIHNLDFSAFSGHS